MTRRVQHRPLMSLNMLIETVGGRNYTAAELRSWLEDIGYGDVRGSLV